MLGRNRGGKAFLSLDPPAQLLAPVPVGPGQDRVACLAADARLLVFALDELKLQPGGGKGLTLMDVDAVAPIVSVAACADALRLIGSGRGGKPKEEALRGAALAAYAGRRARRGRIVPGWHKLLQLA
jgi:topoisomerase-4 subunit A